MTTATVDTNSQRKQIDNIKLSELKIDGESYFKISNSHLLRPFFMTIVSNSDHWLFISSNGGLSAGRKNSDSALFPYYTEDKIIDDQENTGPKTIIRIIDDESVVIWEPFSSRTFDPIYMSRNLYKNVLGNKVIFEEINHQLNISFRYEWSPSNQFGFVRRSTLTNFATTAREIQVLDGVQNIIPSGVDANLQNRYSNLVDAYKRNELIGDLGIGIFSLSAIIVDKAEPSESLKASIVWSVGLDNPKYLLSNLQLDAFRTGDSIQAESDIKGERGSYFIQSQFSLSPIESHEWFVVAEVNQSQTQIARLAKKLSNQDGIVDELIEDIILGSQGLIKLTAQADAIQLSSNKQKDARHFSNTLFNIMRGGIFDQHYQIDKSDFLDYLESANKDLNYKLLEQLTLLPTVFSLDDLRSFISKHNNPDLSRLSIEYLPLKHSRRHGDPSRPWNQFSINLSNDDGTKLLDYQGNWRDIFQNWQALALSYPQFLEGMIYRFLNASTFDGYNPYRITKDGFDWEIIEVENPWSYIGYWGDHQIIYLLKLMELYNKYKPHAISKLLNQAIFVYADVPYRIKPFDQIITDPKDTIEFDHTSDQDIRQRRLHKGADAALLRNINGEIVHVSLMEKLMVTLLAKLSNFIPNAGIWMNTQRPEWNDANNALVGNGASMVTLYYMIRFLNFFEKNILIKGSDEYYVSKELATFFLSVYQVLADHDIIISTKISNNDRKKIVDGLGHAASEYRQLIYEQKFSTQQESISINQLKEFTSLALSFLRKSAESNRRVDGLYHAYNLITIDNDSISIEHLSEMLEGQVAILSSGLLNGSQTLQVLDALKSSALFRPDQYSYLLYPNKDLPGFMSKNNIPQELVRQSSTLTQMLKVHDKSIIEQDVDSNIHFNTRFRNSTDLRNALNLLKNDTWKISTEDIDEICNIYESVFNHKAFTGRSGTFFGYEGLGSIYWHMVSKLLLAVQENCLKAISENDSEEVIGRLLEHYYEIQEGIGVHKSPEQYGAFPTDAYSHTPAGKGAQQPGMTGQVKEDILVKFGELGVIIHNGCLQFLPQLLRKSEFLKSASTFTYINLSSIKGEIELEAGCLGFTYCQVPIIYRLSNSSALQIHYNDGEFKNQSSTMLTKYDSQQIFNRTGIITQIEIEIPAETLR